MSASRPHHSSNTALNEDSLLNGVPAAHSHRGALRHSLDVVEREGRAHLLAQAPVDPALAPIWIFLLSIPVPLLSGVSALFVPLLGIVLIIINAILWVRCALVFRKTKFFLPSVAGISLFMVLWWLLRWGQQVGRDFETIGGVVIARSSTVLPEMTTQIPVVGYFFLAFSVGISICYIIGYAALLWHRASAEIGATSDSGVTGDIESTGDNG